MASDSIFGFLDRFASSVTRIFASHPLPRNWNTGNARIFALWLNFVFLIVTWTSDWIFLSCWFNFRLPLSNQTSPGDDGLTNSTLSNNEGDIDLVEEIDRLGNQRQNRLEYQREIDTRNILYGFYLFCLISSTLLIPLHIITHMFALWRHQWRQTLVLTLELIALLTEFCSPPILVAVLFAATYVCPSEVESGRSRSFQSCQWRTLTFAVLHILALVWQCLKMAGIGLCCCCCSGLCTISWPIYNLAKKRNSSDRPRPTLGGTVLNCMPPETDRGSWLNGTKWFLLTSWVGPLVVLTLMACSSLIAVMIVGENFLHYDSCNA